MNPDTDIGGRGGAFPPTAVSIFRVLRQGGGAERDEALQRLVRLYWKPVYCVVRYGWNKSNEDAKDLTQQFFVDTLFEGALLEKFTPQRGSFRSLLKASVTNFMRDSAKAAGRQKRGGGSSPVSLEMHEIDVAGMAADAGARTPEDLFDAAWKQVVMNKAVEQLSRKLRDEGKAEAFEIFRRIDLEPAGSAPSYGELARELGLTPDRVKHALTAARQELRRAVLETVAEYVESEEGLRSEMDELFGI